MFLLTFSSYAYYNYNENVAANRTTNNYVYPKIGDFTVCSTHYQTAVTFSRLIH